MSYKSYFRAAALLTMTATALTTMSAQDRSEDNATTGSAAVTTTTVTNATGSITQLNYEPNGSIGEFLIGTNILLSFPTNVTGGLATLGAVGNSVTYSGTAETTTSGFQTVRVSTFTNNTTKATYTASTTAAAATAYGPTSGTVKQANYDSNGAIDGFTFTPATPAGAAAIFVSTGSGASATLKPLLTVGATVSVIGTVVTNPSGNTCVTGGTLTAVNASSLIIGAQTIVLSGGNFGGGRGRH